MCAWPIQSTKANPDYDLPGFGHHLSEALAVDKGDPHVVISKG